MKKRKHNKNKKYLKDIKKKRARATSKESLIVINELVVKKKRGRPVKIKQEINKDEIITKKKRGRPPKVKNIIETQECIINNDSIIIADTENIKIEEKLDIAQKSIKKKSNHILVIMIFVILIISVIIFIMNFGKNNKINITSDNSYLSMTVQ